jgi:DNA-binding LacI/PurR family transcriptional regulator
VPTCRCRSSTRSSAPPIRGTASSRIAHITGPERHHSATVRAAAAETRLTETGLELVGAPLFGDMELAALGRAAADLLLAAINGEPAPGSHSRPCRQPAPEP